MRHAGFLGASEVAGWPVMHVRGLDAVGLLVHKMTSWEKRGTHCQVPSKVPPAKQESYAFEDEGKNKEATGLEENRELTGWNGEHGLRSSALCRIPSQIFDCCTTALDIMTQNATIHETGAVMIMPLRN
jgi:hypothetical protein